ncbi:putative CDP-alcohol phosphatidyltransferase class-I family protein C22A12.08c [Grifola frondosa]|uniref:Putative CDP-alcohol phosphatidyltransferase class-I family protein C22A12.08c n=1 Tax=Grifola frondosa TaxID=5627 RepID=A0A1C7LQ85_GRIFR|nr:putative CDP-alcohol phosphatidyltransferase class-I family protein C22A12.08c [Grifola frondosa]
MSRRHFLSSCLRTPAPFSRCAHRALLHSSPPPKSSPLAFTLDIVCCHDLTHSITTLTLVASALSQDGVLLRGPEVLPATRRALAILEGANPMGIKIPYILLTNGGGVGEEVRSQRLSEKLGVPIHSSQIIQAHTVLKSIAAKYANDPVLVLGGKLDEIRQVAEGYGFKQAFTPLDVLAWNPSVWPFYDITPAERESTKVQMFSLPLRPRTDARQPADFSTIPITAVIVFHDPRNWALDIQILLDLIRSRGRIGAPHPPPGAAPCSSYSATRTSSGSPTSRSRASDRARSARRSRPCTRRVSRHACRAELTRFVHAGADGTTYPYVQFGKPTRATYEFAEAALKRRLAELQSSSAAQPSDPNIYMVGDNPESDIVGANAAGWTSILVHTGVYDPEHGPPTHRPRTKRRTWRPR